MKRLLHASHRLVAWGALCPRSAARFTHSQTIGFESVAECPGDQEMLMGGLAQMRIQCTENFGSVTRNCRDALAFSLPVTVIAELLGIPLEDVGQFREWSNDLLSNYYALRAKTSGVFAKYFDGLVDRRHKAPLDDLQSDGLDSVGSGRPNSGSASDAIGRIHSCVSGRRR